jgi:hypothetical protein
MDAEGDTTETEISMRDNIPENQSTETSLAGNVTSNQTTHFPYRSSEVYRMNLSAEERNRLDEEEKLMRNDPTRGTDDWKVILHVNMNTEHDNLYFACYRLKDMEEDTIQLVQAKPYNTWKSCPIESKVEMKNGDWHCVCLQPFHGDSNNPNESSRWRYQIHQLVRNNEFSTGFYSFDDATYRPEGQRAVEWAEPVSLLKSKSFVYGPFSWKKPTGNIVEFRIDHNDWHRAITPILAKKTKQGTLFWKGFEDSLLSQAGCTNEEIEANKDISKFRSGIRWLPVRYNERDEKWQKKISKCDVLLNKVRFAQTPYCWENPSGTILTKGARVGSWIGLVTKYKGE